MPYLPCPVVCIMISTLQDLLAAYPVVVTFPVHWGDMDAFQHVNNIQYFKYWETARITYFERIGFMDELRDHHIGPILASTGCLFRFPLTYPDTVSVGCRTLELKEDRFLLSYVVVSQTAEQVAARGEGMVVSYDYTALSKTALPEKIRTAIRAMEGESLPV